MARKPAAKLPKTQNPDSRMVTIPFKVSINEAHELEKKALFYCGGKRSLFVRAALLNYKPKKEDFK